MADAPVPLSRVQSEHPCNLRQVRKDAHVETDHGPRRRRRARSVESEESELEDDHDCQLGSDGREE